MRRRSLVQLTGLSLAAGPRLLWAQDDSRALRPLNRFPRMVHEHMVARVREIEEANLRALEALRTRADAEAYVARVRAKIREIFTPSFGTRTSLDARVTGRLMRDTYVVEKVLFESRPGPHGYAQDSREAMYRWFNRWTGVSRAQTEPKLQLEKDQDLWAAPRGQVSVAGSRTVFSFTKERAEALARERRAGPLDGEALVSAVTHALRLGDERGTPDFRVLRPVAGRRHGKAGTAVYVVETEPGLQAIVYLPNDDNRVAQPARAGRRAILWVADRSSDAELREDPLADELARAEPKTPIFACDVRGVGESQPDTCRQDSADKPYGSDYFYAAAGVMLDRPYVGGKTRDVLRVLEWLAAFGYEDIHLVGRGRGVVPATFAALLSDRVTQVTLKNALTSYTALATTERYGWPLSTFVPGVLRTFDLDDCYRALQGKKLRQIEPAGA